MIESFRFSPDADHAARCDRAMHAGLADSLRQICDASDGKVEFDRAAIERLTAEIATGRRLPPNAFAHLLRAGAGPAGRQFSMPRASRSRSLARQQPIEAPLRVLALGEPAMADQRTSAICAS